MADEYSPEQVTNLRSHSLMRHTLTTLTVIDGNVVNNNNESTQVIVGCHDCNMGLDEAADTKCPGEDLFDTDKVFGPTEE